MYVIAYACMTVAAADSIGDSLGPRIKALREAIRKELRESRYVSYFRPGTQDEGGDGVTVAWLQ